MHHGNFQQPGDGDPSRHVSFFSTPSPAGPPAVLNHSSYIPPAIAMHPRIDSYGQMGMNTVNHAMRSSVRIENITIAASTPDQVYNLQNTITNQARMIKALQEELGQQRNPTAEARLSRENEELRVELGNKLREYQHAVRHLPEQFLAHSDRANGTVEVLINWIQDLTMASGFEEAPPRHPNDLVNSGFLQRMLAHLRSKLSDRGDRYMAEQAQSHECSNASYENPSSQTRDIGQHQSRRPSTNRNGFRDFYAPSHQASFLKPKLSKTMKVCTRTTGHAQLTFGGTRHRQRFSGPSYFNADEPGSSVFIHDGQARNAYLNDMELEETTDPPTNPSTDSHLRPGEVIFEELEDNEDYN